MGANGHKWVQFVVKSDAELLYLLTLYYILNTLGLYKETHVKNGCKLQPKVMLNYMYLLYTMGMSFYFNDDPIMMTNPAKTAQLQLLSLH